MTSRKPLTEEQRANLSAKISAILMGNKRSLGHKQTPEHKEALAMAARNRKKITCEGCGRQYTNNNKRHHVNCV